MMIESKDLKDIDDYSKIHINQGVYFLYSVKHAEASFLLKTDTSYFFLNKTGSIIDDAPGFDQDIVQESVYFSDIELPVSANSVKIA